MQSGEIKSLTKRATDFSCLNSIYEHILTIKVNPSISERSQLAPLILNLVNDKPGWGSHLFDAQLADPRSADGIAVSIGASLNRLIVRDRGKINNKFEWDLLDLKGKLEVRGL